MADHLRKAQAADPLLKHPRCRIGGDTDDRTLIRPTTDATLRILGVDKLNN